MGSTSRQNEIRAASFGPRITTKHTGIPAVLFHVDPLALAWGEDGEPYLLSCTWAL